MTDQVVGTGDRWSESPIECRLKHVVGSTSRIFVAVDWTDFDDDAHTTLCVSLITTHGRATPLVWRTVKKSKLRNRRTRYELEMVERVYDCLPRGTHATWLGDPPATIYGGVMATTTRSNRISSSTIR